MGKKELVQSRRTKLISSIHRMENWATLLSGRSSFMNTWADWTLSDRRTYGLMINYCITGWVIDMYFVRQTDGWTDAPTNESNYDGKAWRFSWPFSFIRSHLSNGLTYVSLFSHLLIFSAITFAINGITNMSTQFGFY